MDAAHRDVGLRDAGRGDHGDRAERERREAAEQLGERRRALLRAGRPQRRRGRDQSAATPPIQTLAAATWRASSGANSQTGETTDGVAGTSAGATTR